ncbi:MAG: hypothetical protein QGG36_11365 [Pirellulaceae bacterium]|nr:hypothetical protein [Pirellulaceae bacterium]MDP7016393.1 hypothetical protein [Pirellulaceae bacterium]
MPITQTEAKTVRQPICRRGSITVGAGPLPGSASAANVRPAGNAGNASATAAEEVAGGSYHGISREMCNTKTPQTNTDAHARR